MLPCTASALLAAAALLATAACSMEKVGTDMVPAPTGTIAEPAAGQELHLMFEAEKRNAVFSELPAQF
jgi:hypothetical protein